MQVPHEHRLPFCQRTRKTHSGRRQGHTFVLGTPVSFGAEREVDKARRCRFQPPHRPEIVIVNLSRQMCTQAFQRVPDFHAVGAGQHDLFPVVVTPGKPLVEDDKVRLLLYCPLPLVRNLVETETVVRGIVGLQQQTDADLQKGLSGSRSIEAYGRKLFCRPADGVVHEGIVTGEPAVGKLHACKAHAVEYSGAIETRSPVEAVLRLVKHHSERIVIYLNHLRTKYPDHGKRPPPVQAAAERRRPTLSWARS